MTRGGKRLNAGRPEKLKEKLIHTVRLSDTEKDFIGFSRINKINLEKLKKTLILLVMIIFCTMPAYSYTLQGSVEYTVDSARAEAFNNIAYSLSMEDYKNRLTNFFALSDVYDIKRSVFRVGIGTFETRRLVPFYQGRKLIFYGVQYDSEPNKKYYYLTNGKLIKFDISNYNGNYPYKSLSYDAKGNLKTVTFATSEKEAYMYDSNKKFIGHWLNNQFYEPNGKKGITRRL